MTDFNSKTKSERRKNFPLRLSKGERAALEEKAKKAGLKLSPYLREAGLNKTIPRKTKEVPQINRKTYVELGRIGININQLAKAANTSVLKGLECNINTNELSELLALLQEIRLSILGISDEKEIGGLGDKGTGGLGDKGTGGLGDGEIGRDGEKEED